MAEVILLVTFLALYRGETVNDSILIATSIDLALVSRVADELLGEQGHSRDKVVKAVVEGKRNALRLIAEEQDSESSHCSPNEEAK